MIFIIFVLIHVSCSYTGTDANVFLEIFGAIKEKSAKTGLILIDCAVDGCGNVHT